MANPISFSSRILRRWVSGEAQVPWPLLDEIFPCLFQAKAEQLTLVCDELVGSISNRFSRYRDPPVFSGQTSSQNSNLPPHSVVVLGTAALRDKEQIQEGY